MLVVGLIVGAIVGSGIWFFESQKRKERERDQAFQDEWIKRKGDKA